MKTTFSTQKLFIGMILVAQASLISPFATAATSSPKGPFSEADAPIVQQPAKVIKTVKPAAVTSASTPAQSAEVTPAYTKEELLSDYKNVQRSEMALQAVGLKISIHMNEKQKREISWDFAFMDTFKGDIHTALPILQNYLKVADDFLKKYDRDFTIAGSTETADRYSHTVLPVVAAKVILAQQGIDLLQKK